jgi:hypothetical protein
LVRKDPKALFHSPGTSYKENLKKKKITTWFSCFLEKDLRRNFEKRSTPSSLVLMNLEPMSAENAPGTIPLGARSTCDAALWLKKIPHIGDVACRNEICGAN